MARKPWSKKIEISSITINASFKDVWWLIIPRKLFWIFTTNGFFKQILTVNNNKLFPLNILDIHPFGISLSKH
jgi:hypothetical protein